MARMDADDTPPAWREAYPELRRIASARLRSGGDAAGLNTTALVHESWLRLADRVDALDFASRGHFYAYCGRVMRSVIVDTLRRQQAECRGGNPGWQTLDTALGERLAGTDDSEALRVDEALQALAAVEPRLAQVVEMRYFGGFEDTEIAAALGLTERTVRRDWVKARALLQGMLAG